eukprot:11450164-Karenia_brevis.AAC.1
MLHQWKPSMDSRLKPGFLPKQGCLPELKVHIVAPYVNTFHFFNLRDFSNFLVGKGKSQYGTSPSWLAAHKEQSIQEHMPKIFSWRGAD